MYKALYREYRPQNFSEVKGQDVIVKALTNQLKRKKIGHAYLFSGTRGTGKTTMAKLFAKAVNCTNLGENGEPCNQCENCKASMNGSSPNVFEIDAASNNGVDNVREIRDNIMYKPIGAKYRVYIIDEVHMLSSGAFNALLKTLEEPPEHVIFILATTETQKVPATIFSRCQHYAFKRVKTEEIKKNLLEILQKEGVAAEDKAVEYIARAGDGSMRDALSILEQCISFDTNLTFKGVLSTLGTSDVSLIRNLMWYVSQKNREKAVDIIEKVVASGVDYKKFADDVIWYLRNIMMYKAAGSGKVLDLSDEQITDLAKIEPQFEMGEIERDMDIFSELINNLKFTSRGRVLLEVAVIKATTPTMGVDVHSLQERVKELEKKINETHG